MMLTDTNNQRYDFTNAAKSAGGIGVPKNQADTPPTSGFFVSETWQAFYGRAVRGASGHAGSCIRYANLHGFALHDWRRGKRSLKPLYRTIAMANYTQGASAPTEYLFETHSIRTIDRNGEIWFVAPDICAALDITNVSQAVQRLDDDERSMLNIGRQPEINIINESGLYSLILRSRKPEAKRFKKWVTSEVLPTIRKTGRFSQTDTRDTNLPHKPKRELDRELVVKRMMTAAKTVNEEYVLVNRTDLESTLRYVAHLQNELRDLLFDASVLHCADRLVTDMRSTVSIQVPTKRRF